MTYIAELNKLSRTPITLVVISMDNCALTFAQFPCLASGVPCFNTFQTCKYKLGYLRQVGGQNYMASLIVIPFPGGKNYKFTFADTPQPFKTGERPYLKSVTYLPTEIKNNLTVNARMVCAFYDEPDNDIGYDPYIFSTSINTDFSKIRNIQYCATLGVIPFVVSPETRGTFFKKFIARNQNYKGRFLKVYEGFLGLEEKDFIQKWAGTIDLIKIDKNSVNVEAVDLLKSLAEIEIPPKLDIKLNSDITETTTLFTVSTTEGLSVPVGYIRMGDEIMYYSSISTKTNTIAGCIRGMFNTIAGAYKKDDKIQVVRYYQQANPFDILIEMLEKDAGVSPEFIDYAAFEYWRDFPERDIDYWAVVSEPLKLDKIFFEIVDSLDCKCWVNEDLKITISKNLQNEPGRSYQTFTDTANIVHNSANVDLNPKSRISRIILYSNKTTLGKIDEVKEYSRLDIAIEAEAENAKEYGEVMEKKVFSRWIHDNLHNVTEEDYKRYIKNHLLRQLLRYRDPMPILSFDVELKDSDAKTGEFCRISTDEMCDIYGKPLERISFQTIRRERKGSKIMIKALQLQQRRIAFVHNNDANDYGIASDAEKEYGYITDDEGKMPDEWGYFIF